MRHRIWLWGVLLGSGCRPDAVPVPTRYEGPIIDVHLHAATIDAMGPPPLGACVGMGAGIAHDPRVPWEDGFQAKLKDPACEDPMWSPATQDELREQVLAEIERLDVVGVLSGPRERVAEWKAASPERIVVSQSFGIGREGHSPEELAEYHAQGGFEVFGEIGVQYRGMAPDDPKLDPYWRLAAERDIPVGIHIGVGPPGAAHLGGGYRARLHSPLGLEEVLVRHPTLRVYVMHAAWPMVDELKAMLYSHPHLYVDTGVLQIAIPRAEYYAFLEELVRAGFTERILFGSDEMVWPAFIAEGIDAINEAPFLTLEQKRAILHDNAVRFLRLDGPGEAGSDEPR